MQTAAAPLRIGILGTAKIARDFIDGVRPSTRAQVVAVASRDGARAAAFADALGIGASHGSYEALLADGTVDAVYNPLPNSLHAAWSIQALEAGKHVLCEKPLAITAAAARAMFAAARRHGRELVEAYPYRAQPLTQRLCELLAGGEIGAVRMITASFGFPMPAPGNIRLDAGLGGGSLWDAGCYPVSLVRMLAGECPVRVHACTRRTASGVDTAMTATLEFASGLLAQVSSSFGTAVHRHALIAGATGIIETSYLNHPPAGLPATLWVKRGTGWGAAYEAVEAPAVNGFRAEAESFCDLVRRGAGHWTGATPAESIDIARTLEAIERSARAGTGVAVGE